ncbi:MAG: hypothetical protein A2687_01955 [Candidatus Levybacteria bacterium RIFCSPHIGHO2_01_FULL_38_26]|nr:MAG: hypothetical protein A2687_01955 [Candidatus Levybacteria bacterium RIFCSPHIGHO2_01_FULL_38_26]
MTQENEQSIQKRPELVADKLIQGGLIVGVESGIQGSLMSVTGAAIERITRERTEVPPQFKLPERAVYFLDPNSRRLIMISNRENRGEDKTPDKYGLFAEIVELDEEGKPHYSLSTSEIILPNDNYQLVAVGPNNYGLPPSHIEVVEEEEEGKKKFVPWNLWLGTLQNWMNEVNIDPNEDFGEFVKRFENLRRQSQIQSQNKIKEIFRESNQGIDDKTIPSNMIITDQGEDSFLYKASLDAGFYPIMLEPKQMVERYEAMQDYFFDTNVEHKLSFLERRSMAFNIHQYASVKLDAPYTYNVAVITIDEDSMSRTQVNEERRYESLRFVVDTLQKENPIFSVVSVRKDEPFEDPDMEESYRRFGLTDSEPKKNVSGWYRSPSDEEQYRGLLNKLKADLLLTMFLRGGAPIIK